MALIRAFAGALGGTFADQWKDIITAGVFDEHAAVMPGVFRRTNNGRGSNTSGSEGIITNGSKIYVPENTAAFIFDQAGIETTITAPGGYEYRHGERSVFDGDGIGKALFGSIGERFAFGGQPEANKRIAFVNLREIRGIRFGTPGPLLYNDLFYGTDLEIRARGMLSLRVADPVTFIRHFVPANMGYYSFDDPRARQHLLAEFMQSFTVGLNSLSNRFRISQLPAHEGELTANITADASNTGTWRERFGIALVNVSIESVEFTPESRELVKQFSSNKMSVRAYEDVSPQAGNIAAQQKIAQGIENQGLGDMGGMVLGMNIAQGLGSNAEVQPAATAQAAAAAPPVLPFSEQIEAVKKLKELLDAGILSQAEFDIKKKEILGL